MYVLDSLDPSLPFGHQLRQIGFVRYGTKDGLLIEIFSLDESFNSPPMACSGLVVEKLWRKCQELQGQVAMRFIRADLRATGFFIPEKDLVIRVTDPWEQVTDWVQTDATEELLRLARAAEVNALMAWQLENNPGGQLN